MFSNKAFTNPKDPKVIPYFQEQILFNPLKFEDIHEKYFFYHFFY